MPDPDLFTERCTQPIEWGNHVRREDGRTAATKCAGRCRIGADHRNLPQRGCFERQRVVVLDQHHAGGRACPQLGAELHAVYVIGDYFEQISVMFPEGGLAALTRLRSYVQERMANLARGGGATHITEGRPYQEIVKLADTLEADLIVIGTAVHGSLFGTSNVLGSEIERVIRNAPCPVLCVPAARVLTPLPALVTQIVPQT